MKKPLDHNRMPRICFVAHDAYGAMVGGNSGHIGGVERQTSLMARWFASRGYQVSIVTWDEGQEDNEEVNGVRMLKLCREDAGILGLRFFWPRWTSLIAAIARADADIYYQNCAECVTGQVALWCRSHGRRFVYSVASDLHCDRQLPETRALRDRLLYRYAIRVADRVIVQTTKQREMLQSGFRRDSLVLPMPCPGPRSSEYVSSEDASGRGGRVLWIGRIHEMKRPDRLLELAEMCPDLEFDFVGPMSETEYAQAVCNRAQTIANVTLHGPVARPKVPDFYRKASVLCCTSDFEGFPNTFIEAWSYGLPVVSTFDPDGLVTEKGLGRVGNEIRDLAEGIYELLHAPERWRQASQAARKYFVENHEVNKVMERFEGVFCDIVNASCDDNDTVGA